MSPALLGALVGLAFAVAEYFWFGVIIDRAFRGGREGPGPRLLDYVRKGQLILFPVVGWLVGPIVARSFGV
jgi:hypothetical protein